MNPSMKKSVLVSSIALALCATNAEAALITDLFGSYSWSTDSANFTLLSPNGGVVGGTNDVYLYWNGNAYNSSSDYTGPGSGVNVTMSSTALFFGHTWAAHDIQVFVPGSYSFDVGLGGGNPETGTMTATVGATQLGLHMLFDWGGNNNIDVFVVGQQSSVFGSGLLFSTQTNAKGQFTCDANYTGVITKNCLYDGALYGSTGAPTMNQVWMLASADGNGDGVMGIPMASGGPFQDFNANFNAIVAPTPKPAAVPVPATVWLFGSGLMGLVAAARRRGKAWDGKV